jgi:DNA-binding NtrC family response regulator
VTEIKNNQLDLTKNVLLASQSPHIVRLVLETLARKGIRGLVAGNARNALDFIDKTDCAMAIIEDMVPRHSGGPANKESAFELLAKIRLSKPELPVVMIAADDYSKMSPGRQIVETAVRAILAGCRDFMSQPVSRENIEKLLDTIVPCRPVHAIASAEEGADCVYKIVGTSPSLVQTVRLAQKVAATSAPVLISGESGTGKELISYVVHYGSRRAQGPFIKVNCAALSETLLESELFGHEKGAFTGAYSQRKGRFEEAHGGTLLLDEISETPLCFQAKLLRILEQQDFQRVGGNQNIKVDVRIISTTNKDLSQEVADGQFRQDLYYRLCGVRLVVSPLRQRKEDLPDLVWYFVNLYAGQTHRRITRLDTPMMDLFAKYHWPGNIRQLRNVILTSMILGVGETLSLADVSWLFNELQPLPEVMDAGNQESDSVTQSDGALAGIPLAQIERQAILETLKQANGNQTRAAKVLGISDRTLRDKVRRYRQQVSLQPA